MTTHSDIVNFGTSSKGRPTVIYKNFEYTKVRTNDNGEIYWRCKFHQSYHCLAHIKTLEDRVITNDAQEHNHQGNLSTSLARQTVAEMKERMNEISATPAAVVGSVSRLLEDNILQALPKRSSLTRTLQRFRKAALEDNEISVLPSPPVDTHFEVPRRFEHMILYDSGTIGERFIILGSREMLDGLARAKLWLADGTFKVVPSIFFQLYTIHFELAPGATPVALYCLLQSKTRATYENIINQIRTLIPSANPERILVDFETAAISAFQTAFPNATISGCFFHLCQSVLRKVNEMGMKSDYETQPIVCQAVRCIFALALVPIEDVAGAFEVLSEEIDEVHERMPELLSYFEHTYIRGRQRPGRGQNYGPSIFSIHLWNHYRTAADGIARTTNSVEGWHYGLQTLFQCHHPTLWTFLDGISKDMQRQRLGYLQAISGISEAPRRKYRELKERVRRAVSLYSRANILQYLRTISHVTYE